MQCVTYAVSPRCGITDTLHRADTIKRLVKGEGTYLVLTDDRRQQSSIPVSRQQKERLMERFGWV